MRQIWMDCDPGVDDAIAILMALASSDLDMRAITTVGGNVSAQQSQQNAQNLCAWAGFPDVPVYAGENLPLRQSPQFAHHIHGPSGLGQTILPQSPIPLRQKHGVEALIETLMLSTQPITLVATGPLTNIARALIVEPRIIPKIEQLVIMGGSSLQGNITPEAEFNFYVDPDAAHIVFQHTLPIVLLGLDVTYQALVTSCWLESLSLLGLHAKIAADMMAYHSLQEQKSLGLPGGPLHDPCTIGYLIKPQLFSGIWAQVKIETQDNQYRGKSLIRQIDSAEIPQVLWVNKIQTPEFFQLIERLLSQLS